MAAALSVEGVRLVHDANLLGAPRTGAPLLLKLGDAGPTEARALPLAPWQLPCVREVLVVEGGAASALGAAPAPAKRPLQVGLPVPVAKERC